MKTHEFRFHNLSIRAVEIDGQPWFVATDLGEALGFPRVDNMVRPIHADERQVIRRSHPHLTRESAAQLFGFRQPSVTVISESGLYKLVMRSDKDEAKVFQDWVTRTVLPAIRKDGGYIRGEELVL